MKAVLNCPTLHEANGLLVIVFALEWSLRNDSWESNQSIFYLENLPSLIRYSITNILQANDTPQQWPKINGTGHNCSYVWKELLLPF